MRPTEIERAATHYDRVTEAWRQWVMGEELHFGLFETGQEPLPLATQKLTTYLAAKAALAPGLTVLDVGSGIGTQALYLAEHEGCAVTGISTSEVGVELARARAQARGVEGARFELRDATDNGLADQSFDRIYSMESAHLMDKERLFRECFRVLRPGGKLALCDVVLVGHEGLEIAQYAMLGHSTSAAAQMRGAVQEVMHRAFGSSTTCHTSAYVSAAEAAGFEAIATEDLSAPTRRTLSRWSQNAADHRAEIEASLGRSYLDDLFLALLHMSFGWGRLAGYFALTATKP